MQCEHCSYKLQVQKPPQGVLPFESTAFTNKMAVAYCAKTSCSLAQSDSSFVHCCVEMCTGLASCNPSLQGGHRSHLRHVSSDVAGCQAACHSRALQITTPGQSSNCQAPRYSSNGQVQSRVMQTAEEGAITPLTSLPPCTATWASTAPALVVALPICSRVWQQVSTATSAFFCMSMLSLEGRHVRNASSFEMQEPALAEWTGDRRFPSSAPAESSSESLQSRSRQPLKPPGTQCSQSRPASHLGSACAHPVASLASCLLSLGDGPSHVATSALQGSLADSSCLPAAFHHSLAHNCSAACHGRQGLLPYSTVCHLSQGVSAVQGGPQQC